VFGCRKHGNEFGELVAIPKDRERERERGRERVRERADLRGTSGHAFAFSSFSSHRARFVAVQEIHSMIISVKPVSLHET
jgi:hypothetical protein